MRVISGKYKGRTLLTPKTDLRPTLDRTKETLFNILRFSLEDKVVLDLFAGSGQLGFEALSCGAKKAVFCDVNSVCVEAVKSNAEKLNCTDNVEINKCGYDSFLANCAQRFDIVFIDPPYESELYLPSMKALTQNKLLKDYAIVVCEHKRETDLPEKVDNLLMYDNRKIGAVQFSFYKEEKELI